ncbi:hypothetical protein ACJBCE_36635 [Streptomyces sp. NBUL23]|uniref:hypothetical protein n=1 Tax=Streptomyces sp. NBUL23 TaxID=3381354 RepID=UPI0038721C59
MRTLPLAVAATVTAALLTGCVSVAEPDTAPPRHRPAGQSERLPSPPAPPTAPAPPPVQPRGLEELAWMGPSPAASATADHKASKTRKKPTARPDRPRRSVSTPWRARPSYPRKRTPAAPKRSTPRSAKRWTPGRVPTGGGMRSVCRSAHGVVSPGLAGLCRSVGR